MPFYGYRIILMLIALIFYWGAFAWADSSDPRPVIVPVPVSVAGVDEHIVDLNGVWKFTMSPPEGFWKNETDVSNWSDIKVPGEAYMQGFAIQQDQEFAYKTSISIPETFTDKTILLRFAGAYSAARVWVNGVFLKQHVGGFTSWDVDITEHVTAGNTAHLTVAVTDQSDDISRASFYAKHNIGGILRDVNLLALPKTHLTRLHVETDLDKEYKNAGLKINAAIHFSESENANLVLRLMNPDNERLVIDPRQIKLSKMRPETDITIPVKAVALWDAEHPRLYTLEASLKIAGKTVQSFVKKIGFREVRVDGEQLLVNGKAVKLRGVNRHSIDPIKGRTETAMDARTDILLFKQANVNFIRTSHYPPTESFLDYADELGVYVELEAPLTWWNTLPDNTPFTSRFMDQFAEMIERDRSHASVIIWSLGNESFWDSNFAKGYEYVKRMDPTRPVMWSYAPPAGPSPGQYDIFSEHYPEWDAILEGKGMPILLDEYAHVTSYEFPSLQRDPNIRNFWGQGLKKFWENILLDKRILGAAIWGGIDEVFLAPDRTYGYGQWGIIDGWRRPKPEFWLTKKAYSPIRVNDAHISKPAAGQSLSLQVQNWFDHTNFNEVKATWSVGADSGVFSRLNISPHTSGVLTIPARDWRDGEVLNLRFYGSDNLLIDAYGLLVGSSANTFPRVTGPAPEIQETSTAITISGESFSIQLSKKTGLILAGSYQGKILVQGGPRLILTPAALQPWVLKSLETSVSGDEVVADIVGSYGDLKTEFTLHIDGAGLLTTTYSLDGLPENIQEIGITYELVDQIDKLSWDRKSLWSIYPDDHIGRPQGVAQKLREGGNETYGKKPDWPWSLDMKDFFLFGKDDGGRSTNDFRSTKENIFYASAILAGSEARVRVESDGSQAVRMGRTLVDCMVDDKDPALTYVGIWKSYDDGANCLGTEEFSNEKNAYVQFRFFGDTVKWIGPSHYNMGQADIFIDGELKDSKIDLYSKSKINQRVLFSTDDLVPGWHTVKVVVTGEKNPEATDHYVVIDGFHYSNSQQKVTGLDLNILDEWGYDLKWGNFNRLVNVTAPYSNSSSIRLTDSDKYVSSSQAEDN